MLLPSVNVILFFFFFLIVLGQELEQSFITGDIQSRTNGLVREAITEEKQLMTLWTPEVYFFFFLHTLQKMHIERCTPWYLALSVTRILNMHDIWQQVLSLFYSFGTPGPDN